MKEEQSYSFELPKKSYNLRPNLVKKFDPKKPSLIFTAGPTGSGKSSLVAKTLERLYHKKVTPKFKEFLIDDYVETSPTYKAKVDTIVKDFQCQNTRASGKCDLIHPSKPLLLAFEKAYFQVRKLGPCHEKSHQSCQSQYYTDIRESVEKQENIAIETTGKNIPKKWFRLFNLDDYNLVFVYSIVSFTELVKRNKQRAKRGLQKYMKNHDQHAPRLPDLSISNFLKATNNINDSLITLRNKCLRIGKPNQELCGPINSSGILLIFDNDQKRSKLIYDSRTSDNFLTENEFKNLLLKYQLSIPH